MAEGKAPQVRRGGRSLIRCNAPMLIGAFIAVELDGELHAPLARALARALNRMG